MGIAATLFRVQMKMSKPFSHARAVRSEADDLVFCIDVDGVTGVGECVPRDYVTGESVEAAMSAIGRLDLTPIERELAGVGFADGVAAIENLRLPDRLACGARPGLAAACAVELALLDVLAKRANVPASAVADAIGLPAAMRRNADAPLSVPATRALDLLGKAADLTKGLFQPDHVKLKGTSDPQLDIDRARDVRAIFGDRVTISVDANMSWSLDDAIRRWESLQPFGVGWFEEPLAQYALADYRKLRESGVRVMLDESLCSFEDGRRAVEEGACDMFNIRISKNGGLIRSLRLAELAHLHGLGMQLGSHPGQMGILGASGARFVSIVARLVAVEGADRWVGTGGMPERIIREDLRLDAKTGRCDGLQPIGLGVTPELDVIERYTVERARWTDGRWAAG